MIDRDQVCCAGVVLNDKNSAQNARMITGGNSVGSVVIEFDRKGPEWLGPQKFNQLFAHLKDCIRVYTTGIRQAMPAALVDTQEKLLRDLQAWARAKYGRPALLARTLGVSRQLVSHWLTGRRIPTLHHGLAILAFLRQEALRAKRKKTRS